MTPINITNGPSREELFDALRLFAEKRLVPLCLEMNGSEKYVAVLINSIEARSEGGELWILSFFINRSFISESFFASEPKKEEKWVISKKIDFNLFKNLCQNNYLVGNFRKNLTRVECPFYSTKTRNGALS